MRFKSAALAAIALFLLAAPAAADVTLVESVPVETVYGLDSLPDAPDVWLEMIAGATESIDIESFYYSQDPDDQQDAVDLLVAALAEAADRGVRIRLVGDKGFMRTYSDVIESIGALPGAEARLLDARSLWGGVQHSKFFVVDGREFYIGSQNWDWRALTQIRELGARVRHPGLTAAVGAVFAVDWALAGGEEPSAAEVDAGPFPIATVGGDAVSIGLAASPPGPLPPGVPHDEPMLVEMIDGASTTIRLQLLSYNPGNRDNSVYTTLDAALRRAAARGVQVRIILANWSKRYYMLPWIQSLAVLPNIEICFTNIPDLSTGFVPFSRVEHAKYLVADRGRAWIGTANWAEDYFHQSRNLSLFCEGAGIATGLIEFFDQGWHGPYAETVDPCGEYEPPRRQ